MIVMVRAEFKCVECDIYLGMGGDCHHLTYEHFGNESPHELQYLCRECHSVKHILKYNELTETWSDSIRSFPVTNLDELTPSYLP